jgi:TrmH family RNA methyltransferase
LQRNLFQKEIKQIQSLRRKRIRDREGLFVAEGVKSVHEALNSNYEVVRIYSYDEAWLNKMESAVIIPTAEMKKISSLATPSEVLALVRIPGSSSRISVEGMNVILDGVSDPGNLGTIIRLCDWFGVSGLFITKDSVDPFNSKVVQASMGSIFRVVPQIVDMEEFVRQEEVGEVEICSADMSGESLYDFNWPRGVLLVMGSESHGVSEGWASRSDHQITIPSSGNAESLNVASAASIMLYDYRRSYPSK